ncbi:GNAT family N-acetyltransferase [Noviherbaspirillum soli]|uniref:GNAT family N-acetyltransferase n=1 Tax=Noviherbaspirillum soli TaxID=1064518 RepID=UPI00188D1744|nr:GNAT family N-acetyltransferase [Noviherbaspirillum soli]
MEPAVIQTARLRLRPWREEDKPPFRALNADPRVMACFPSLLSPSQSDALAERFQKFIEAQGWGFWAVECNATQAFIGFVGLHARPDALPFSPCVEIGWRLAHQYWGRGYASEAAGGALRFGFDRLQLEEIVAFTAVGNVRSRAVMERLGMREDGNGFDHPALPEGHPLRRHCLYRISASAPA